MLAGNTQIGLPGAQARSLEKVSHVKLSLQGSNRVADMCFRASHPQDLLEILSTAVETNGPSITPAGYVNVRERRALFISLNNFGYVFGADRE